MSRRPDRAELEARLRELQGRLNESTARTRELEIERDCWHREADVLRERLRRAEAELAREKRGEEA